MFLGKCLKRSKKIQLSLKQGNKIQFSTFYIESTVLKNSKQGLIVAQNTIVHVVFFLLKFQLLNRTRSFYIFNSCVERDCGNSSLGVNFTNLLSQSANALVGILRHCCVSPIKLRPTLQLRPTRKYAKLLC